MNEGFGKDFYRKDNSVKRSGRFNEPPDSESLKVAVLIPFKKVSSYWGFNEFNFFGTDCISFEENAPLSLVNGPLSFRNRLSGSLRLGAQGAGTFNVRRVRGDSRQKIKKMPSVKILAYS